MTKINRNSAAVGVVDSSPLKPVRDDEKSQKVYKAVGGDEDSVKVRQVRRWRYQQRQTSENHHTDSWHPELHNSINNNIHCITVQT